MSKEYNWNDLYKDMEGLRTWMHLKPKWWQFRKLKIWRSCDPRQYWR